jgi:chromosome segregation ATPase
MSGKLTVNKYGWVLTAFVAVFCAQMAVAAPREGSTAADAGIKRLLGQLSAERDALAAEKIGLQSELDKVSGENAKLSAMLERRDATLTTFKSSNENLVERLKSSAEQGRELTGVIRGKDLEIARQQSTIQDLEARIAELEATLAGHLKNNKRLTEIAMELVGRYENKGLVASLKQAEPLTQLGKVELENLVQEYRFEIEDLNLEPGPTAEPGL